MNIEQRLHFLQTQTLLFLSEPSTLQTLAARCSDRLVKSGEVIVKQGDKGEVLRWIVTGHCAVEVGHPEIGIHRELRRLGPGDFFGEVSLLTGTPHTATVTASTDAQILELEKAAFLDLLLADREMLVSVLARLGRYMIDATQDQALAPLTRLEAHPSWQNHRHALPGRIGAACRSVVLECDEKEALVGMTDPYDMPARAFLTQVLHPRKVAFAAINEADLKTGLTDARTLSPTLGVLDASEQEIDLVGPFGSQTPLGSDGADAWLRRILTDSQTAAASDVHIEPTPTGMQVRLRIHGNLARLDVEIPPTDAPKLVSRLKVLAGLDITERRRPLDGSFVLIQNGRKLNIRIAILPAYWGEKMALRLLPAEEDSLLQLEHLVPDLPVAAMLRELFKQPTGLVLVCGPTGSGKTTLLYAGLKALLEHDPVRNCMAIEDPVDRLLSGVTQIPVNRRGGPGFTEALRAVLRQDPDVLLVGEIRDRETAETALEAAVTGHLVLSSLHAPSATEVVARLRSLDVPDWLVQATLKGVVCLRLVSRNCPACATLVDVDDPLLERLREIGIEISPSALPKRGTGCPACNQLGVFGRLALLELLVPSPEDLTHLLAGRPLASKTSSWLPMRTYALMALEKGWVTPEAVLATFPQHIEVNRALGSE